MRYAFVMVGSFSGVNDQVRPRLASQLPELQELAFDVRTWVRGDKRLLAGNLLAVVREFGPGPFRDRRQLWGVFFKTRFLRKRLSRELARQGPFAFTFQTQSLFDGSVEGSPHFVYTDHTALANRYYPDYDRSTEPPDWWIANERRLYERADRVFVFGSHVKRSLSEQYGIDPGKVLVVGSGANAVTGEAPPHRGYDGRHVLFVGREWERKGGPELLAAFARVRERLPDARLTVAGCTPDLGDAPGVTVRGWLTYEQLSESYSDATAFCMPSLRDRFANVYIEALMHAVPVVATRLGSITDVVADGETGLLVEPHDVDGLAAALTRLLEDPGTARAFGDRGRASVQERFTWDAVVARMAAEIGAVEGRALDASGAH